jgi:hypothetical protein
MKLGGIGSTIKFYDLSGEFAIISQGVVQELHSWGIVVLAGAHKRLVPHLLFIEFVKE